MSTDLSMIEEPQELQLIAASREQMAEAQKSLIGWAQRKIAECTSQVEEASKAKTVALAGGFETAPFTRQFLRATKLVQFYEKIKAAVEAGYVIIPDFPVDVFAIRTKRYTPEPKTRNFRGADHSQSSESPPIGEGQYVDSEPLVFREVLIERQSDGTNKQLNFYRAEEYRDLIDFPMSVAKPEIMSEVSVAMQHKVFDEIGVLPNRTQKKKDPIVVGIVRDPRSSKYSQRRVMFLLAWYLDTRTL